jgi:hypothetical protein
VASIYQLGGRTADALPLTEKVFAGGRAQLRVAVAVLLAAQQKQLMPAEQALDDALNAVQRGTQSQVRCSALGRLIVQCSNSNDSVQ